MEEMQFGNMGNPAGEILTKEDYKRIVENLLFITDRPLSVAKISQTAQINNIQLTKDIINGLAQEYVQTGRAIQIVELGGGFQMSTKPEYGRWVRALFNEKTSDKLSAAALETLAIIAYKQPVTRADIEAIRGVDIVAPLEKIMERGLVRIVGRKDAPGKPMVYGTTDEFLRLFGLNHISQLPELKSFENKGPKEIQSDLPFGPSLPEIKTPLLPLDMEVDIFTRNNSEILPLQAETNLETPANDTAEFEPSLADNSNIESPIEPPAEDSINAENLQIKVSEKTDIIPAEGFRQSEGIEEDMLKEGLEDLK